jgi:ketosteroid isomerase-like protein
MDLASERARLLQRDADWATVASEGSDLERILSYWTDDAVVMAPGLPVIVGKDALRLYVQGSMQIPGFKITWTTTDVTFSPDGNLAYLFSRNAVTMNTPAGTPNTTAGRAVTIWRRESDDEWRCAVDIWNAEPAVEQALPTDQN